MSPEIYKDEYSIEILEKSLNYRLFWNVTDKLLLSRSLYKFKF